jgi:hypothetical protein
MVPLYTITSQATESFSARLLEVAPHEPATNPQFPCARVILCDEPVYTSLCVATRTAIVSAATTDVEDGVTWSSVKRLFR